MIGYALPMPSNHEQILRVVVRQSMSFMLIEQLVSQTVVATKRLCKGQEQQLGAPKSPFQTQDGWEMLTSFNIEP